MIDRRAAIAGGLTLGLLPQVLRAASAPFSIDWQGGPQTPAVAQSLAAQIALVEGLRIKPGIAAFFAAQPIAVDREPGTHTRAGPRGIFFERRPVPADNPVLLHELLHRYQLLRLPDGAANATVRMFYDKAKAEGRYPPHSYMLTRPFEFYAMMASVILYGRASRPPLLRAIVAQKSPEMYAWIVEDFGLVV